MDHHLRQNGRTLNDCGIRCEVALQNGNAALLHKRILHMTDDLGIQVHGMLDVLAHRLAGDRHAVQMKKAKGGDLLHDRIDTACLVQILHVGGTCRCQMAQIWRALADLVCLPDLEIKACFMGDGREVQHGVGGAAKGHIDGQSVQERVLCHDVTRTDISPHKLHDLHAGFLGQTDPLGINSRNGAVAAKAHAKDLGQAVHAVCGVHAGAGAAGRTYLLLIFCNLLAGHRACRKGADGLKHRGETSLSSFYMACHHRAAADKDRRNIDAGCCHQQTRYILVAVRDHDQTVKLMRDRHALCGIRDQITGDQGILHADMAHGNTVTYGDGREYHRGSACHGNAEPDRLSDLIQVHMTGNDLVVGADDTDHRPLHLLFGHSKCVKQTAGGGRLHTYSYMITIHLHTSLCTPASGSFRTPFAKLFPDQEDLLFCCFKPAQRSGCPSRWC